MSSRRDQKEQLKAERLAREREAQTAERRKRLVGIVSGAVLVVAAAIALIVVLIGGGGGDETGAVASAGDLPEGTVPAVETADLQEAADKAGCELEEPKIEGNAHFEPPETNEYESNPPTSGDHYLVPAEDGAYLEAAPTEGVLHTLEHGRVAIQYDPALDDTIKGDLTALFEEDPYHMVLTPNTTDMPFEVAATAWGQYLGCPEANEDVFDAIRAFKDEYRDQGPEFVP